MDPFDERILEVLKNGKPRAFHQVLKEVDFSHNTLRLHLNALVEKGLIIREKTRLKGVGRPNYTYSISHGHRTQAFSTVLTSSEIVTLSFKGLRRLCRFQRGGKCREIKGSCEARNCPQILKKE
jgi:DNA-binding Lrp family transcriptional regulator